MRSKSVTLSQMVQSACTRLDNGEFQLNNDFSGNFQGNPGLGAHTHIHIHIYTYTYTHTHIHIHIFTYTYTHTHIYTKNIRACAGYHYVD